MDSDQDLIKRLFCLSNSIWRFKFTLACSPCLKSWTWFLTDVHIRQDLYLFAHQSFEWSGVINGSLACLSQDGLSRGEQQCRGRYCLFSVCSPGLDRRYCVRRWQPFKLAMPSGGSGGFGLGGGIVADVSCPSGGGATGSVRWQKRVALWPLLPSSSHLPLPTCVSQCQVNMVAQCACRSAMCFQGRDWQCCTVPRSSVSYFHPLHLPSALGPRE